jgi:hypothetical protein
MIIEPMKFRVPTGQIAHGYEATGYQDKRTKEALAQILEDFIAKELRPWIKTFPDDYYKEIFRLNRWPFIESGIKKRPSVVGAWTNDVVEELLSLSDNKKARP